MERTELITVKVVCYGHTYDVEWDSPVLEEEGFWPCDNRADVIQAIIDTIKGSLDAWEDTNS